MDSTITKNKIGISANIIYEGMCVVRMGIVDWFSRIFRRFTNKLIYFNNGLRGIFDNLCYYFNIYLNRCLEVLQREGEEN